MVSYTYELKIPHERIAVLIGTDGKVKKELEDLTKTSIRIDSSEGDIFVSGADPIGLYNAREIIQAVGRGFNPDLAKLLLKPDYSFEVLDLADYCKTKNDMVRLKGRVIGFDGKSRRLIEFLTDVNISVYGKTIGIIGEVAKVILARRAVDALLRGSTHSKVYHWLEAQRRDLKSAL
ncbi:MAG: KH domain-containing protein [Candidatus Woesearchaeota archaeon]